MSTLGVLTFNLLYGGVGREGLIGDVPSLTRPDITVFTDVTPTSSFNKIGAGIGPYRAGDKGRNSREYPAAVRQCPRCARRLRRPPIRQPGVRGYPRGWRHAVRSRLAQTPEM